MSPTYSIVASKRAYSKEKPENGKSKEFIGRELAEKLSANMPSTSLFIPIYSQYCYVIQHTKKGDEIVNIWKEFPSNTLVTKMFQSKLHECMKGEEIIAFTKVNSRDVMLALLLVGDYFKYFHSYRLLSHK